MTSAPQSGGGDEQSDNAGGATGFNTRSIGSEPRGATPLDEEDLEDLMLDFVATRGDLNVVESENITKALRWARAQATRRGHGAVLDYAFLFELHKQMFGDVWRWAGTQRKRETNIGVESSQIPEQSKQALDDAYWHEHETYPTAELAARLHRRLVAVHPFPTGNGRCTRLLADLYLLSIGEPPFTWGALGSLDEDRDTRQIYLNALRAADGDDYEPLVSFARS